MPSFLRNVYMFAVWYLSIGPILSALPIPGPIGSFMKLATSANAGPLFVLHGCLVILYTLLFLGDRVTFEQIQKPGTLSQLSIMGVVLPAIMSWMHCSSAITDWDSIGAATVTPIPRAGVLGGDDASLLSTWASPGTMCTRGTSNYKNITTTYRKNLPPVGPQTTEPVFLGTISKVLFDSFGHDPLTDLQTVLYPSPITNDEEEGEKNKGGGGKKNKSGLLIYVHGGGWWTGSIDAAPLSCYLDLVHPMGWNVASIDYRLGKDGWSGEDQIQDVKDVIRHLIKTHKNIVDRTKVVLIGSSAGAHLALLAAYQLGSPTIAGVVAVSPSTSVDIGMGPNSNNNAWMSGWDETLATKRMCEDIDNCNQKMSPLEQISEATTSPPPTVLAHGSDDEYYTIEHSRAMRTKLVKLDVPHIYMEFPLTPHAYETMTPSVATQMTHSALRTLLNKVPF